MNQTYMFQNRFAPNVGGFGYVNRFAHGIFEGSAASGQYRQLHQMKVEMPSDVLQLFKANQVGFLKAPVKPKCRKLDPVLTMGINLMQMFQIPNLQLMQQQKPQTREQRHIRIAKQKKQNNDHRIQLQLKQWNPFQDDKVQSDPQKTLLVAKLNYQTTEKTLKFQFQKYGIIKRATIIKDLQGKSCGYGFIEFDSKEDFINAYKQANNKKIDGKRILIDYQRGRTVLTWRPRRFGGGKGNSRLTKQQIQRLQQQQKQKQKRHEQIKQIKQTKQTKQKHNHRGNSDSPRRSRSRSNGKKQKKKDYDDKDRKRSSRQKQKERKDKKDKKEYRDRRDR